MSAQHTRGIATALPCSPTRALLTLLRTKWRRRRCTHLDWTPLDGCPGCGKAW